MGYEKPIQEQERISRQSNLKLVVDYMKVCETCLSMVEIIQISTVLNDYVMNGYSKEIKDRFDKIDQIVFGRKPL